MEHSGKGIFAAPSNQGLTLKQWNANKRRNKERRDAEQLDRFADLLADGYEPAAAAIMLGCIPEFGATMLRRICRKLGSQAR